MLGGPKDRLDRIISIIYAEIRAVDYAHGQLDSTPVLHTIKEELLEFKADLNDQYTLAWFLRSLLDWVFRRRVYKAVAKVAPLNPTKVALSYVLQAKRDEENRQPNSKVFTSYCSKQLLTLDKAAKILIDELERQQSGTNS